MPIIYSLVSRTTAVLAEFTSPGLSGNFSTVTRVLLTKIPKTDEKLSYIYDKYVFHYVVSSGLTYLCMADQQLPRSVAFEFLDDIRNRFISTYGERAKTAIAFAFNADFQRVLQTQMDHYNAPRADDKVTRVREEINAVKDVMIRNIDKVLERGEKIELLVDKTEELDQQAFKFKKQAKNLKNVMWWRNAKILILLVVVLLVVIFIILASACGGVKLPKCT